MNFVSLLFLYFFAFVGVVYFVLPHKFRWVLLLAASYYFYMCWRVEYILLIIASTLIDYWAGIHIEKAATKNKKRFFLFVSIACNLSFLFFFKYYNFFSHSANVTLSHFNLFLHFPYAKVLLPVGISFYTFQTLSYTIDVYRGACRAEKHLGIFAVYVSFFPQLVAGPIERSTSLLPQFYKIAYFDCNRINSGLRLMLWGFFKKIVIANNIAPVVERIFASPSDWKGLTFWGVSYLFAFQIYCDFSGYSDIAIGAARVFDIKLMKNFNCPYFADSIAKFWRSWHISLTSWFKDYIYIPLLGGNHVTQARWILNVFIIFLISGVWHGANWTFLLWGLMHGIFMILYVLIEPVRQRIKGGIKNSGLRAFYKMSCVFITFNLVCILWIFFRANNVADAWFMFVQAFNIKECFATLVELSQVKNTCLILGIANADSLLIVLPIFFMLGVELLSKKKQLISMFEKNPLILRWSAYCAIFIFIILFGQFNDADFIYFQF